MPRQLVVVTGPIASGKTILVNQLAAIARQRGSSAASIYMDDIVEIIAGNDWRLVRPENWQLAREMASIMAETLFLHGVETVFIAGPFFSNAKREHLLGGFAIEPPTLFVLLRVSLEESVRRAQADPARILTKDPAFVARIYATIDWDGMPQQDVDVSTDRLTFSEVLDIVADQVLGRG